MSILRNKDGRTDAGTRLTLKFYSMVLLAVILLSASSVTAARYITSVSAADGARVARFAFSADGSESASFPVGDMQPGDTAKYTIYVENFTSPSAVAETTIEYEIRITTSGNLPLVCNLSGVKTSGKLLSNTGDAGILLIFSGGAWSRRDGELPAGVAETHTYTLELEWPISESSPAYADEIDYFTIHLDAASKD